MLVIGSNTTETHPVIGYRIRKAKRKGAKLIVADPRNIELAKYADVLLQLKPGTDVALLNGLAHVIIKEGFVDSEFIKERTEDFEKVEASVEKYTPEYVEKVTGVAAEDIITAARIYGEADAASIFYTMGITQHTSGTNNVFAIANLAMMTGNLGKAHAGVNPLRGQNNVQGACDMGALPNVFPGYQAVTAAADKFSEAWQTKVSDKPGLTVSEMMDGVLDGNIKAMLIMGENPILSDPDGNHVKKAFNKLDFLVVQDIFLTDTAEYADVVLPAASFAEKDGTFTNTERRVQRIRQAITPRGDSKPDWQALMELGQKLGFKWSYNSAKEVFAELASLTPQYAGLTYEKLEKSGIQWPCPDADHEGTKFLHKGKFNRGLGKFHAVEHEDANELPDADFPYLLTTGRILYHYHTGTMSRRSKLEKIRNEELMQINPLDAEKLGIKAGDVVDVESRRGQVKSKVDVTDRVPKGVVFMTFHFKESAANLLTNSAIDPTAKTPEFKVCAVKIKKTV